MLINGVEILSEKLLYSPQWFGIAAWVIIMCLVFFFAIIWLDRGDKWAGPVCGLCFVLFIICMPLNFTDNYKTFLNHPSKIEYTIEITDDNAWKEIGPNYKVIEKLYETKEIYKIEGDYVK